jgi:L-histidine Nalpha-methyltransferase / hercynylcysteine S-oxide synthase
LGRDVDYYALDVSEAELRRTLAAVPHGRFAHVKCYGLHGTYDDGLEWLKSAAVAARPKSVLSMGSSIGNFDKAAASRFLGAFAAALRTGDRLLIGIDACHDPAKVFHAYNDTDGVTHRFILNGLEHANQLLGSDEFDVGDWRVIGEYRYDAEGGRHVAFVTPTRDVTIDGILVRKDEKIQIEESNKFSPDEANRLFLDAGLQQGVRWTNETGDYGKRV